MFLLLSISITPLAATVHATTLRQLSAHRNVPRWWAYGSHRTLLGARASRPQESTVGNVAKSGRDARAPRRLFSKTAEHVILIFLRRMALMARARRILAHRALGVAVLGKTFVASAAGIFVFFCALVHHAHHLAFAFGHRVVGRLRIKQIERDHRAIGELALLSNAAHATSKHQWVG